MQTCSTAISTIPKLNTQSSKTPDLKKRKRVPETYTDPKIRRAKRELDFMGETLCLKKELNAFQPKQVDKIGEGGFGKVYKYNSKCVAKTPNNYTPKLPHELCEKGELNSFLRKHPKLFAAPITDGIIEFQSYAGPDMFDVIVSIMEKKNQEDPEFLLFKYALPLSEGLFRLHENGFIHGDLKIENLAQLILDFDSTLEESKPTFMKGTEAYMHPTLHKEVFAIKNIYKEKSIQLHNLLPSHYPNIWDYMYIKNIQEPNNSSYLLLKIKESKGIMKNQIGKKINYYTTKHASTPLGSLRNDLADKIVFYENLLTKLDQFNNIHTEDYFNNSEKASLFNLYISHDLSTNFNQIKPNLLDELIQYLKSDLCQIDRYLTDLKLDIQDLKNKRSRLIKNLNYWELILKENLSFKKEQDEYSTFTTPPHNKKSYDIYAFSLSLIIFSVGCLNTKDSYDLIVNITNNCFQRKQLRGKLNQFTSTFTDKPLPTAVKLINFILDKDYLSSKIKDHTNSAKELHEFIASLNDDFSSGVTSVESASTGSDKDSVESICHEI
jgi:hypothetical protein